MEHVVLSPERRQHTIVDVLRAFVRAEARGLVAALWRPFWKTALCVGVPSFLVFAGFMVAARGGGSTFWQTSGILFVLIGFAVVYGALAGLVAGLVSLGVRLVGRKFLLLTPLFLAALVLSLSLFVGRLVSEGQLTVAELARSAQGQGLPETAAALTVPDRFEAYHQFAALPLLQVFAAPLLVRDAPLVLVDVEFLWQYFLFLRIAALAAGFGCVPAYLVCLGVLWKSGVRQLAARYRSFVAQYGVVTHYSS